MSENLIAYWRNWLDNEIDTPTTPDGYIFKYTIVNQMNSTGEYKWVCCTSRKKLYSFIKYFILPSIELTRTVGLKEDRACLDVVDYVETVECLDNPKFDNYLEHVERYKRWFNEVDKLEKENTDIEELAKFIDKIQSEIDYHEGVYVGLELFENISSVGKTLVKNYEEDGVLEILECELEISKEEILELFDNIDNNKFMLKKITDILRDRLG